MDETDTDKRTEWKKRYFPYSNIFEFIHALQVPSFPRSVIRPNVWRTVSDRWHVTKLNADNRQPQTQFQYKYKSITVGYSNYISAAYICPSVNMPDGDRDRQEGYYVKSKPTVYVCVSGKESEESFWISYPTVIGFSFSFLNVLTSYTTKFEICIRK